MKRFENAMLLLSKKCGISRDKVAENASSTSVPVRDPLSIPELKHAFEQNIIDSKGRLLVTNASFVKFCVNNGYFEPYSRQEDWIRIDLILIDKKGKPISKQKLRQAYHDLVRYGGI